MRIAAQAWKSRRRESLVLDQLPPEECLRGLGPEELRKFQDYLKTLH
jgi:hypothetical protein